MLNKTNNIQKINLALVIIIFGAILLGCSMIKNSSNNGMTNTTNTTPANTISPTNSNSTTATNNSNSTTAANTPLPSPTAENTKAEEKSPKSDKNVIAIDSLLKDYQKSKENVQKKYDGKEITVRGFTTIPPTMSEGGDGSGLISIQENSNSIDDLTCWFNKADAAEFIKIKGDQFITIKGIFDGEMFPQMQFCKVVKIEPKVAH